MIKLSRYAETRVTRPAYIHLSASGYGRLLLLLPITYENRISQNLSAFWRYKIPPLDRYVAICQCLCEVEKGGKRGETRNLHYCGSCHSSDGVVGVPQLCSGVAHPEESC